MRKILSLFVALTAVFSLSAKTLYLTPTDLWTGDNAIFSVYAFNDNVEPKINAWVPMTAVDGETGIYSADVEDQYPTVIFCRVNPNGTDEDKWKNVWNQTINLDVPTDDKDLFTIQYKNENDPDKGKYNGAWSKFTPTVVDPNKFYVTGDSAFVKDAGSDKWAWDPKAIGSENDTLVLNLKAGRKYSFKVLPKGDWDKGNKGYSDLTEKTVGLMPDTSYNVRFALATAGEVKIVYTSEVFKVIGDFAVEDLKFVPGIAAADNAKFAAWIWEIDQPGAWTEFFAGEGDTLSVKIAAIADSVIFGRFKPEVVAPYWPEGEDKSLWNNTGHKDIDHKGLTFTVTSMFDGIWEVYVPAKYYITGSENLVGEGKAWTSDAIKVTEDTYTFENLAAGKYQLKVVDGDAWKGIDDMSEVAAGLYKDQEAYVCFILGAAGDVKVTYKKGEGAEFTLEGDFVAPEVKLIGINGWEDKDAIALEVALDGKSASKTMKLDSAWYDFKVIRAGEWLGKVNAGDGNYKIHRDYNWVDALVRDYDGLKAISLEPNGVGDYTFTYDFAAGKLTVTFPDLKLANGYYLMGVIGGAATAWNVESLKAEHLFEKNTEAEGDEYALNVSLKKNDDLQVVSVKNDAITNWFPGGKDGEWNYKVDADIEATIYFRPNKDGGEGWWHNCILVTTNAPSAVENTEATVKAVKMIENGMLIIEKNGVKYNVIGAVIR